MSTAYLSLASYPEPIKMHFFEKMNKEGMLGKSLVRFLLDPKDEKQLDTFAKVATSVKNVFAVLKPTPFDQYHPRYCRVGYLIHSRILMTEEEFFAWLAPLTEVALKRCFVEEALRRAARRWIASGPLRDAEKLYQKLLERPSFFDLDAAWEEDPEGMKRVSNLFSTLKVEQIAELIIFTRSTHPPSEGFYAPLFAKIVAEKKNPWDLFLSILDKMNIDNVCGHSVLDRIFPALKSLFEEKNSGGSFYTHILNEYSVSRLRFHAFSHYLRSVKERERFDEIKCLIASSGESPTSFSDWIDRFGKISISLSGPRERLEAMKMPKEEIDFLVKCTQSLSPSELAFFIQNSS